MSDTNKTDSSESKSPFNIWWAASGVLLVAIITALVVILTTGPGASDPAVPATSTGPTNTGANPDKPAADPEATAVLGECELAAGDQEVPTSAPAGTEWVPYGATLIPTSTMFGPAANGTDWACYAHSPTGALFAAFGWLGTMGATDAESGADFFQASTVDNPSRATWMQTYGDYWVVTAAGNASQVAGFRFASVDPDRVKVYIGTQDTHLTASMPVTVLWDDEANTWLVDLGDTPIAWAQDPLVGYVPWSATDG
ncbi:hypothetical protein [Agromyces sp. NPDC058126]|uniref:hypothetical protein n=1 Tax=Agromyces sp. NPDC058126 TaxID=3346350 RepID=UPI0036DD2754